MAPSFSRMPSVMNLRVSDTFLFLVSFSTLQDFFETLRVVVVEPPHGQSGYFHVFVDRGVER
jgi:hypothetical protein